MTLWICAATRSEADACRRGVAAAGLTDRLRIVRTGIGTVAARRSLDREMSRGPRPVGLVSSGFAFSTDPGLAPGQLAAASHVVAFEGVGTERELAEPLALDLADVPCRPFTTTDFFLDADDPRIGTGPLGSGALVDMESAAVAELATEADVPYAVLRLVTDTPGRPLPPFVGCYVRAALAPTGLSRTAGTVRTGLSALASPLRTWRFLSTGRRRCRELCEGWRRYARIVSGALEEIS